MRSSAAAPAALLAALALIAPGCAGLSFRQERNGVPLNVRMAYTLEPEVATLQDCLAVLGAPREVEPSNGPTNGQILTWAWAEKTGWGFFFSLPLSDLLNASLNFDAADSGTQRLRLVFDDAWILRQRIVD